MNKKGFVIELFAFMIIGIIVVLFFGIFIYGFGQLRDITTNTALDTVNVNISSASNKTIGNLADGMSNLRIIAIIMMVGYAISTLIFAYFAGKHPIWLFPYILIMILLIIFSIYISNEYATLKSDATIAGMVTGFGMAELIISYLPYWVAFIGFLGVLLSIIGIVASRRIFEE